MAKQDIKTLLNDLVSNKEIYEGVIGEKDYLRYVQRAKELAKDPAKGAEELKKLSEELKRMRKSMQLSMARHEQMKKKLGEDESMAPENESAGFVFVHATMDTITKLIQDIEKYLSHPIDYAEKVVDRIYDGVITLITATMRGIKSAASWIYAKAQSLYNTIVSLIRSAWVGLKSWWEEFKEEKYEDEKADNALAAPGKKYKEVNPDEYKKVMQQRAAKLQSKSATPAAMLIEKAMKLRMSVMEAETEDADFIDRFDKVARSTSELKKALTVLALSIFLLALSYMIYVGTHATSPSLIMVESTIAINIGSLAATMEAEGAMSVGEESSVIDNLFDILVFPFKSAFKAMVAAINMVIHKGNEELSFSDYLFVAGVGLGGSLFLISSIALGALFGKYLANLNAEAYGKEGI